jgi:parallel beta-helix repeat protein
MASAVSFIALDNFLVMSITPEEDLDLRTLISSISGIQYIDHTRINITSDADFAAIENVSGNGDYNNPYVFNDFNITDSTNILINIENTRKYFVISNCLLNGSTKNFNGISLTNVTNGLIDNNEIQNCSIGIKLTSTENTTLSDNDVFHNIKDGINLTSSHYNVISNNTVHHNGGNPSGNGIVLDPSNHNLIHNNSVYSNSINGLFMYNSLNATISNNNVSYNKKDGIHFEDTHNSTISDNFVHNNGGNPSGNGIVLDPSNHNQIINNSVYNNSVNGIQINDSINVSIINNSIDFNKKNGIFFENTNSSVISFNLIYKNGGNPSGNGIVLDPSCYNNITNNIVMLNSVYGIDITDGTLNNSIESNDFICNDRMNTGVSQAHDDGSYNTFNHNYWSDYAGTGNYSTDGTAETTDNNVSLIFNEYIGEIPCVTTTTTTTITQESTTTDVTTTETSNGGIPGLSFAVLMSSVVILIMFQRRRKK